MPIIMLRRSGKQIIREETSVEQSAPAAPTHSRHRKRAEKETAPAVPSPQISTIPSPVPSVVADFIRKLEEEDVTMPISKLQRSRIQVIWEEEVVEQSAKATPTCHRRKSAEKAIPHEPAPPASDTEEFQEEEAAESESPQEAPSFFSEYEIQARAGE